MQKLPAGKFHDSALPVVQRRLSLRRAPCEWVEPPWRRHCDPTAIMMPCQSAMASPRKEGITRRNSLRVNWVLAPNAVAKRGCSNPDLARSCAHSGQVRKKTGEL